MTTFQSLNLNIHLITGFAFEQLQPLRIPATHNKDFEDTNMVWSLYQAIHELGNDFIVCYGDIVVSPSIITALLDAPFDFAVVSDQNWLEYWSKRFDDPLIDAESFAINSEGDLSSIGQKVKNIDEISGQYIGLLKLTGDAGAQFKNRLLNFCENDDTREIAKKSYMTDFLQILINEGFRIKPVFVDNSWIEIDTPKDIDVAVSSGRIDTIDRELKKNLKTERLGKLI